MAHLIDDAYFFELKYTNWYILLIHTIMNTLPKVLSSQTRVRFQDADPYKHLNNSKYIDYLINAREDQVEEAYGLNFVEIAQQRNLGWVVAQQQIAYLKPAYVWETVYIDSQLTQLSNRHLEAEIRMWDKDKKQLKAFLWVRFVAVGVKEQRVKEHPEDLMDLLGQVLLPLDEPTFEARHAFWRQENKKAKALV
ncbi:MAG: acyl-CoA thioesterase [Aureispira sp.]